MAGSTYCTPYRPSWDILVRKPVEHPVTDREVVISKDPELMDGDEWLKEMLIVVKPGAGAAYQILSLRNKPLDGTDPDTCNTKLRAQWKVDT